jgi:opacity protein-like surface antigen
MRTAFGLGSLLVVALPLTAAAQPPPPPPPTGGGMPGATSTEPLMRFDAGLIIGLPQQDLDAANTSPGINLQFGYTVAPNISVLAGLRYFSVQFDNSNGIDFSNYDFDAGARYSLPLSPTLQGFGEAMLIYSTVSVSANGDSQSWSGIGFGARGGVMTKVSGNISVGGALSFTTASIKIMDNDGDAGWIGLEGFASFGF